MTGIAGLSETSQLVEYFAPCTLGLEQSLCTEIEALGAEWAEPMRGGVTFGGDQRLGYAANLWLRTAIRVQEKMSQGRVRNEDELYSFVQEIDWSRYMGNDHTLAIDASVRDSGITHSQYAALKVKDAIVDQFRDRTGKRPNVDTSAPDVPIKLVLINNKATLYRNMSGDSLHKRGWRPIQVKSPLNEALAAGLLMLSGWDRESVLVDPMCGSGTLLIEAAHLATDRAPGLMRVFAFELWPDHDEALWAELRGEAEARVRKTLPFTIEGNDLHRGAIGLARHAADAAGVEHLVRFSIGDARDFQPKDAPAHVVSNPPYGQRLGTEDEVRESWTSLGNFLHNHCRGATANVLCGNPALPRLLGLKASRKTPVMNGPIDCRWLRYEIRADRHPRRG